MRFVRQLLLGGLCLTLVATSPAVASPPQSAKPRLLFLVLDGIPIRVAAKVYEQGAFAGWSRPVPMVSTFPSMTNVAFTAMLARHQVEPIPGYEKRLFKPGPDGSLDGGAVKTRRQPYPWRELFDISNKKVGGEAAAYLTPKSKTWRMISAVEKAVMESNDDLVLAHLGPTDVLVHFRGDEPVEAFLLQLDQRLTDLQQRHLEKFGRPLRIVMLSDHGNTHEKVKTPKGLRETLLRAGLDPAKKIKEANDVITPTYGVVSYGALYLHPQNAELAARAMAGHESVNLAAWVSGEGEVRMVSREGEAVVRWREGAAGRELAYDAVEGDPLRMSTVVDNMTSAGVADRHGFATEEDWFENSVWADFPDGPRRVVDSLTGKYVGNSATVMLSLEPDSAWGLGTARFGAYVLGGHLEGTHGGLDRTSTLGFYMANDTQVRPRVAIRAEDVLEGWLDEGESLSMVRID
ncbi:MAG: hypothetical protein EP299_09130 [Acidobacteria bacterium]|nr:MAG: hypothetical protein EP299_09130 [Acidobacteriota bacterium]